MSLFSSASFNSNEAFLAGDCKQRFWSSLADRRPQNAKEWLQQVPLCQASAAVFQVSICGNRSFKDVDTVLVVPHSTLPSSDDGVDDGFVATGTTVVAGAPRFPAVAIAHLSLCSPEEKNAFVAQRCHDSRPTW